MNTKQPLNKHELAYLSDTLGYPLLISLTGIHPDKLFKHIFNVPLHTLPDDQLPWADIETKRLRFLQKLLQKLRGSYNDEGIRRWFCRHRCQLNNKRPGDYLYKTNWNPDEPKIQKLLRLAKSIDSDAT